MTEQTEGAEVEAAEELLACECGHSLDEHNGLGCYARLTYTPTVVKCDCPLTDDRTYAELLAPRLAARESAAEARGAERALLDLERRIRHQAEAAQVGSMEWRAHFADLAHLAAARAAATGADQ